MDKMFWKATGIRAIKTMCQTAVALIGSGAVGILDVDWISVLSASALAGIISVLTSIATGLPEVDMAQSIYMDAEEPEDSFIGDGEIKQEEAEEHGEE
jgi:hypothetical protein